MFTLPFDFIIFEPDMDLFGKDIEESSNLVCAKPFLKWAGGKTQLLETIQNYLPHKIYKQEFTYVEPFVGSGAVLFWVIKNLSNVKKVIINDFNKELIDTYISIRDNVDELLLLLTDLQKEYYDFKNAANRRKEYYYSKREEFNSHNLNITYKSALFIFLNRTCFNGLYRVNRENKFNVPIGSYKTPLICDEKNLQSVSNSLRNVIITNTDFCETIKHVDGNTFFYIDPPYKPLSQTSSFNNYSSIEFDDNEQERLQKFCTQLDELGINWLLSNSDVKGKNPNDHFFDDLYQSFNIFRVKARRNINANPNKRGALNELLITNYRNEQIMSVA